MPKEEKVVQEKKNTKVMDKYDAKMKRRKEEEKKAKKAKWRFIIIGVVAAVALVAFVISFPIRNWITVNSVYVTIGGEDVTTVEYAYYYNAAKQDFAASNGSLLSMMGVSDINTIDNYQYTEGTTFGDYFSEQAMTQLIKIKSMRMHAEKIGFTYDTSAEMAERKTLFEETAASYEVSLDDYIASLYGSYATWEKVASYMEEDLYVTAYGDQIMEDYAPTEDEILAEYEANQDNYDCVDYRMTILDADLPETDELGNTIEYTDEEIIKAMDAAKEAAKEAVQTVAQDGEEHKGEAYADLSTVLADYLFFESRKAGDTVILKDEENNRYLAVAFEDRYPNDATTPYLHIIASTDEKAQTILDEWKKGAATLESFEELFKEHDDTGNSSSYYTAITSSFFSGSDIEPWLEEEREIGDTIADDLDTGVNYVVYYAGQSDPAWKTDALEQALTTKVEAFMQEITSSIRVEYK